MIQRFKAWIHWLKGKFYMQKPEFKLDFNDPEKLIEQLDRIFPKRSYTASDDIQKIMLDEGKAAVVAFLRMQYEKQCNY
jgi:hypothetical protein